MGAEQIRRWESGALAHAVTDPFGQGPLPWLRGSENYFDDTGQVVPWYADLALARGSPAGGPRTADDVHRQIKGFTSTGAAAPGEAIDFHITVDPPQQFSVDIYRIGHYGGDGAAKITTSPRLSGIVQPPPLTADRTVSCHHWWLSWRLQIPTYWSIGAYVAVLTTADGYRSHIPFTVRDDHPADLLLAPARTSPGRRTTSTRRTAAPAPASTTPGTSRAGCSARRTPRSPSPSTARTRAPACRSMSAMPTTSSAGPSGTATTSPTPTPAICTRAGSTPPATGAWSSRATTSTGRSRCAAPWRSPATTAPRSSSSPPTPCTGRSSLSPSPSGVPDRLLTCRKRRGPGKPALWREVDRAEQQLLGIQYAGRVPEPHPLVVRNAEHWLWDATGADEGDEIDGLVAGEADRYFPRTTLPEHENRILLAHSPYQDSEGATRHQETSLYRAPSGALVFASGTFAWSPALDRPGHVDPRIQRATANLLDRICKHA